MSLIKQSERSFPYIQDYIKDDNHDKYHQYASIFLGELKRYLKHAMLEVSGDAFEPIFKVERNLYDEARLRIKSDVEIDNRRFDFLISVESIEESIFSVSLIIWTPHPVEDLIKASLTFNSFDINLLKDTQVLGPLESFLSTGALPIWAWPRS